MKLLRLNVLVAILAGLLPAAGCDWIRNLTRPNDKSPKATGAIEPKTATQLVEYLNRNSDAVQSVKYPDVKITVKAGKEDFSLNDSSMICSKPKNLSLIGGKALLPGDMVNLGSNSREFWMYTRFPSPEYVYCSHADFDSGAGQLPIPFDPEWALQAIGMSHYDTNAVYKVELDERNREHRLSYETATPQGGTVRRVIIFAADGMGERSPQVRQHLILDAGGKPIARADIKEVVTLSAGRGQDKDVYVQVPTKVVLEWPQQQFRMDLKLLSPKLNEPIADPERLFSKPQIAGVSAQNLAASRSAPSYRGSAPGERRRLR